MANASSPIRIVIADEDSKFRRSLRGLFESEADLQVLGEAPDAAGAIKLIRDRKPDILLLDLTLPKRSELQPGNGHSNELAAVRMVVMLKSIEKAHIVEAFRLGAHGIVLKTSAPQGFLQSFRSVMTGHYCVVGESVDILVEALRDVLSHGNGATSPKDYGLTPRELDIIAKITSGRSNKEVGEEFSISERTVKHHLTNIFSKVGVTSRLQLALFAVSHQLMANQASSLALEPARLDEES
jgi:DNA-binding NarL/FixJ family response regulator